MRSRRLQLALWVLVVLPPLLLFAALVAIAVDHLATDALQAVLETGTLSSEDLAAMRIGDAPIIYSVGPDQKDDGGKPFDHDKKTGDIIFKLTAR